MGRNALRHWFFLKTGYDVQYYPKWYWYWRRKRYDEDYGIYDNVAGIGPFQWCWYSSK